MTKLSKISCLLGVSVLLCLMLAACDSEPEKDGALSTMPAGAAFAHYPFAVTDLTVKPDETAEEILYRAYCGDARAAALVTAGYALGIGGFPQSDLLAKAWAYQPVHFGAIEIQSITVLLLNARGLDSTPPHQLLALCEISAANPLVPALKQGEIFDAQAYCASLSQNAASTATSPGISPGTSPGTSLTPPTGQVPEQTPGQTPEQTAKQVPGQASGQASEQASEQAQASKYTPTREETIASAKKFKQISARCRELAHSDEKLGEEEIEALNRLLYGCSSAALAYLISSTHNPDTEAPDYTVERFEASINSLIERLEGGSEKAVSLQKRLKSLLRIWRFTRLEMETSYPEPAQTLRRAHWAPPGLGNLLLHFNGNALAMLSSTRVLEAWQEQILLDDTPYNIVQRLDTLFSETEGVKALALELLIEDRRDIDEKTLLRIRGMRKDLETNILSPEETAKARQLYEEMKAKLERWNSARAKVRDEYGPGDKSD